MASTANLATRRRQNMDASRRVTFTENTSSSRLYDYSEDEDEEEQERALSELHGEAEEGGDERKRKKAETDKDIAQELEQEVKKKIRKARPQLVPSHLTSAEGLIRLPVEMKQIKYKPKKGKKRDILAASSYSKNLINAYHSFCDDLFPSLAFEDVLLKIEQLGSKKEVKTFVQHMRDDVRNRHLERLYGREKAEQMLLEVDEHMKQQVNTEEDNGMEVQPPVDGEDSPAPEQENPATDRSSSANSDEHASPEEPASSSVVTPTVARASSDVLAQNSDDEEEQENEAVFEEDAPMPDDVDKESESTLQNDIPSPKVTPAQAALPRSRLRIEDSDDDDEEEATFDDISAPVGAQKETSISGQEEKETSDDEGEEKDPLSKAILKEPENAGSPDKGTSANDSREVSLSKAEEGDGREASARVGMSSVLQESEEATPEGVNGTSCSDENRETLGQSEETKGESDHCSELDAEDQHPKTTLDTVVASTEAESVKNDMIES